MMALEGSRHSARHAAGVRDHGIRLSFGKPSSGAARVPTRCLGHRAPPGPRPADQALAGTNPQRGLTDNFALALARSAAVGRPCSGRGLGGQRWPPAAPGRCSGHGYVARAAARPLETERGLASGRRERERRAGLWRGRERPTAWPCARHGPGLGLRLGACVPGAVRRCDEAPDAGRKPRRREASWPERRALCKNGLNGGPRGRVDRVVGPPVLPLQPDL